MISPAVLDALLLAGATAEQIVAAVKADAADDEARKEKKRAGNRERQARFKANRKAKVTATNADNALPSVTAPPNDIYSNPPEITPVEAKASTAPRGRSDRGLKIPEDWQAPAIAELSTEARSLASQWPAAAYRAEAEAFLNYWLGESGAKARKSNWNRAWANRIVAVHGKVMRQAKFAEPAPVGRSSDRPMTADEIRRGIEFNEAQGNTKRADELRAQLAALKAQPPPDVRVAGLLRQATQNLR